MQVRGLPLKWLSPIIALLIGLGLGCAFFHLPQWACGPFRAEKAAEWTGVVVAAIAAVATFLAVVVALKTSSEATRTAIQIQKNEFKRQADVAKATRDRLAIVFATETARLIDALESFYFDLKLMMEVNDMISIPARMRDKPRHGLVLVERFASDLNVLEPIVSAVIMETLVSWTMYRDREELVRGDTREDLLEAVNDLMKNTRSIIDQLRRANELLRMYVPAEYATVGITTS
jgi:uncharacterized membrane-anchored protein YhcB (DUF1043 family)